MSVRLLDQLRRRAFDEAGPLPPAVLAPGDAVGHLLREDLYALVDLPPAEIATAAGWAVAGPGPWRLLTGRSADDALDAGVLPDGCALAVAANGPLPRGTSAVVRDSDGRVDEGRVVADAALGDHVLARGAECASGTLLVPEATLLTPGAAALAAAGGHSKLRVTPRPSVAVLLVDADRQRRAAALPITPVAAALLPPLVAASGAADVTVRQVQDTSIALRSTLDAVRAELLVVVSGDRANRPQHLDAYLDASRADVAVDGARDGAGLVGAEGWLLARLRDGRLLVALPGDVRWSVAGLLTLVRPLVRGMCGQDLPGLDRRTAAQDLLAEPGGTSFVFVRDGSPTPDHGPATGHGVAAADGVAVVPPLGVRTGETFDVLPV